VSDAAGQRLAAAVAQAALAGLIAWAAPATLHAAEAERAPPERTPGDRAAAERAQLDQRIRLTARLLADPPTLQRIAASGDLRATAHVDEGRVHQALAEQALASGDLATARRAVDDALRHLAQARRLVPDAPARQAAQRQRHEQQLAALERLIDAWRARAPAADGERGATDADLPAALGLIATARQRAEESRYDDSLQALAAAERHVLTGMNRLLHQRTLDYTPGGGTPEQQWRAELARLDALTELVPLALAELKPRADMAALIERYAETARALRAQAQQQWQAGDAAQAQTHLRNGQLYAQRALAAAGLTTPAMPEEPR
jgi:hypothetical protein